jgi:hypothetical protein
MHRTPPGRTSAIRRAGAASSLAAVWALAACDGERAAAPPGSAGPAAALLVVAGDDQSGVVGTELAAPLLVRALDAAGRPVAGQVVNFRVTAGGGGVFAGAAITDADGRAAERWTLGTSTADSQRVEVRAVSVSGEKIVYAVFRAAARPASPARLERAAPDSQSASPGARVAVAPTARVRDRYGNPVPDVPVRFAVTAGGGTLADTLPRTDSAGVASAGSWTVGPTPGAQSVRASVATPDSVTPTSVEFRATALRPAADVAVAEAVWTQGVQRADGSLPMVLDGNPAVVNVVLRAAGAGAAAAPLVLRLTDASGATVWADTSAPRVTAATASLAAPSAQFLVPAARLRPGLRWRIVRDPRGVAPDDSVANDVFPREGDAALRTVDLPTLRVRFVPIVLALHANATGNVTTANLEEYLRTVRSVHPVGRVDARVGQPLTTSASFGAPPSGGASTFWTQVIQELDLARVADVAAEPDVYWYGVVRPPAGFNFTEYGGWGYIPAQPALTGAGTRVAIGVQVGWFTRQTQARDLVAHELAHNMGRRHTTCGGASSSIDAGFPNVGGAIGTVGHDVYSWASGRATSAVAVAAATADVMGYCFPAWASPYTYEALLAARGTATTVAGDAATPAARRARTARAAQRVLVVRGRVEGGQITLLPAVALTGRPGDAGAGAYRAEGLDASGAVVFSRRFTPSAVDHAPVELFTVAVPLSPEAEARLAAVRVVGPGGASARRTTRGRAGAARDAAVPPPVVRATARGRLVRCASPDAAVILVTDASTGAVLGSALGGEIEVAAAGALRVACSDGVRTTAADVPR